ncbi:hypothetical protein GOARA_006_00240 [Gordonia araii NBRC 100433]|uniref:Mce-associated membrane protein n=1 Tax=Gordonia araii NBRC 100433 TaxID=1073574 RepID=G7GXE0_9ACTN|nr:hypothetical protein [Gordonia araii]NNG95949.1 hypothetical protein [Gordonia araii NBRC 100433]GAB08265.1 hypothetical protein GOARA_006_00240 [Gordonia araii NBRC 100433]
MTNPTSSPGLIPPPPPPKQPNPLRWAVIAASALLVLSLLGNVVLGALWLQQRGSTNDARAQSAATQNEQRAEKTALDYAVGAATIDYQDMAAWKARLVANTSPALSKKLEGTSSSMEQIVTPMKMVATATPVAASVRSERNGVYVVAAVVSVTTKSTQQPDGGKTDATYTVTIDKNDSWLITDVGGTR